MLALLQPSSINEMPVFKSKKLGTTFMTHFSGDITLKWMHKGQRAQSDKQILRRIFKWVTQKQTDPKKTSSQIFCPPSHLAKFRGEKKGKYNLALWHQSASRIKKIKIRSSCSFTYALLCFNDSDRLFVFWLFSWVLSTLITRPGLSKEHHKPRGGMNTFVGSVTIRLGFKF